MLKYYSRNIVFQEIPEEISLSYEITGCPLRCPCCHSPHLRNGKLGEDLTPEILENDIMKHKDLITCVLFMGGEWQQEDLISCLEIVQRHNIKTALYTGMYNIPPVLKKHLNYVKLGPYVEAFGGLDSETTNQTLITLK